MTRSRGLRPFHTKNTTPKDPAICPYGKWIPANQAFYIQFRRWLMDGGYEFSALNTYSVAARLALGFLNLPYWKIDPEKDLQRVQKHMVEGTLSAATQQDYAKGLEKLAEFLYLRSHHKKPDPKILWETYTRSLSDEWAIQMHAYLTLRSRTWSPDLVYRRSLDILRKLSMPLRWLAGCQPFYNNLSGSNTRMLV